MATNTKKADAAEQAVALDHTQLLGYWLLPEDAVERSGDERLAVHLKMGGKTGEKFFGGNAGMRRVKP